MFRFLSTAFVAVFCLLLLASSDAFAFGGRRCRCNQGNEQQAQQSQRPQPVRNLFRAVFGHPGACNCQQQSADAPQAVPARVFVTRSSACQFGACEGPGSACWPPAQGCPSGQCVPQGRIVLGAPLPVQACPNGKCPLPR